MTRALEPYRDYLDSAGCVIVQGFRPGATAHIPLADAALSHATSFHTWQSLVRHNALGQCDAAGLMATMVRGTFIQLPE